MENTVWKGEGVSGRSVLLYCGYRTKSYRWCRCRQWGLLLCAYCHSYRNGSVDILL